MTEEVSPPPTPCPAAEAREEILPVEEGLLEKSKYNPEEFCLDTDRARFFVIKSYSEDDIHRRVI